MTNLPKELRAARKNLKLSRRALAELSGVNQRSIRHLETGNSPIRDQLQTLLEFLNLTLEQKNP